MVSFWFHYCFCSICLFYIDLKARSQNHNHISLADMYRALLDRFFATYVRHRFNGHNNNFRVQCGNSLLCITAKNVINALKVPTLAVFYMSLSFPRARKSENLVRCCCLQNSLQMVLTSIWGAMFKFYLSK